MQFTVCDTGQVVIMTHNNLTKEEIKEVLVYKIYKN